MKTMTLNELLVWLIYKSKDEEGNVTSHKYAYNTVWDYIETNRPALEAGMRGTLMDELRDKLEPISRIPAINQHGRDFQKGFKRAMSIIEENRKPPEATDET